MNSEQVNALPRHRRCRLRLNRKPRKYKKQARVKLSREDMIKYLRDRKIRSCRVLEKTRQPTDPNVNDFRLEFGSWGEAVRISFGRDIAAKSDSSYLLKTIHEFGLWSVKGYKKARKVDPHTIPSPNQVIREWGSFGRMFEQARRTSIEYIIGEYRKLARKIGGIPSIEQCRAAGLRIDEAVRFYKTKKEMDDIVISMGGLNERKK